MKDKREFEGSGSKKSPAGAGIGVGAALGVAFGAAFGQLALGLALGTALGAAVEVVAHWRNGNSPKPPLN